MKKEGHPKQYDVRASCVCGNNFETRSSEEKIETDICSNCHPFFSGIQKFVDRTGRIERFQSRYSNVKAKK